MATFKHKSVRQFKFGQWHFKDHLLVIQDPADHERFLEEIQTLPARDRNQIVEINERAVRELERPVSRSVRGAQQTTDINNPKTNPGIMNQQPGLTATIESTTTAPAAKPAATALNPLAGLGK